MARGPGTGRSGGLLVGAVYLAFMGAGIGLAIPNGNLTSDDSPLLLAFTVFAGVGTMILRHRPGHGLGYVFGAVGLLAATGYFAGEYAELTYVTYPGSLPFGVAAAVYGGMWWLPMLSLTLVMPLLLFPTGKVLSPRWRPLAWIGLVVPVLFSLLAVVNPVVTLQEERGVRIANPIGIEAVGNVEQSLTGAILFVLVFVALLGALASLVVRFRRARGRERTQLKVFLFAASLFAAMPLGELLPDAPAVEAVWNLLFGLVVAFLPASVGIAILRYGLYDIDRVINKALVYGLLTALLGGAYAGIVFGLGGLVSDNGVVVAAGTLAVAAAFRPLRRRVQGFIDRRFYRSRYDAARTLEAFGAHLREEVDLQSLRAELVGVVHETMRPASASLWLREEAG